jgi:hypothetical protein
MFTEHYCMNIETVLMYEVAFFRTYTRFRIVIN